MLSRNFFAELENTTRTNVKVSSRLITYILLIVFALQVSFLGLSDFYTRGEAREAVVVQSMISSKNWVLPKAYNETVPSKPPLFHWVSAVASLPFEQVNEFTTRLPSVIFAGGALGLFLLMTRKFFSPRELLMFAVFLTLSFEWLRASMSARVDMVHASCLASGLLMSFFGFESSKYRYWVAASVFFALAVLGKGPVAIAIPIGILSIWTFLASEKRLVHLTNIFVCLSCSLLGASIWYMAAYYQASNEFLGKFWYENVARFASTMDDSPHQHSVFYLFGTLLLGTLPWSVFLIGVHRKKLLRLPYNAKLIWKKSTKIFQFSVLAVSFIFLFYCIPSSKRSVYLLASYPFIAIILTILLSEYISIKFLRRTISLGVGIIVLVQGVLLPFVISPRTSERGLAQIIANSVPQHSKVYSYGFEFYGAAFYSRLLFLRLEDSFQPNRRLPIIGDTVVCFEKDVQDMDDLLKVHTLSIVSLSETTLDKKSVKVFRIINREKGV